MCQQFGNITICGGDIPFATEKPGGWDEPYRMLVPFDFKWRDRLGKSVCDCTMVEEVYRPWYGCHWNHHPDCAIEKHLRRYPGIYNLVESPGGMFAHTW